MPDTIGPCGVGIRMRRRVYIERSLFVGMVHGHEKIRDMVRIVAYEDMTLFEKEIPADNILDDIAIHRGFVADLEHHLGLIVIITDVLI